MHLVCAGTAACAPPRAQGAGNARRCALACTWALPCGLSNATPVPPSRRAVRPPSARLLRDRRAAVSCRRRASVLALRAEAPSWQTGHLPQPRPRSLARVSWTTPPLRALRLHRSAQVAHPHLARRCSRGSVRRALHRSRLPSRRSPVPPCRRLRFETVAVGPHRASPSLYCVRRSVHCLSARNASLVASARAFAKWRSSRTWIGELLRGADFRVLTVWSRRVALALSRVDKTRAAITAARDGNVAAAKRTTAAAAVSTEAKVDKADAGRRWRNYQLDATVTEARKLAVSGVRYLSAWMVMQVTRMRVGVFNTYQRLAQCTVADAKWSTKVVHPVSVLQRAGAGGSAALSAGVPDVGTAACAVPPPDPPSLQGLHLAGQAGAARRPDPHPPRRHRRTAPRPVARPQGQGRQEEGEPWCSPRRGGGGAGGCGPGSGTCGCGCTGSGCARCGCGCSSCCEPSPCPRPRPCPCPCPSCSGACPS